MMRAFGCVRHRIAKALTHRLEPPETRRRHPTLDDDI
jgi:hypothetical protein